MEEHGIRLRPRAILTTLLSRLLVADVFVHGIGGAAYDSITDEIVRRLVGSDPPRHAIVSGTLRLPLERVFPGIESADPRGELAGVLQTLRDLQYHPECHLDPATLPADLRDLVRQGPEKTVATDAIARIRQHWIAKVWAGRPESLTTAEAAIEANRQAVQSLEAAFVRTTVFNDLPPPTTAMF